MPEDKTRLDVLEERYPALVEENEKLLAEAGDRDLTEEEATQFDQRRDEAQRVDAEIVRRRAQLQDTAGLSETRGRLTTPTDPISSTAPIHQPHIGVGEPNLLRDPAGGYGDCGGFGQFALDVRNSRDHTTDRLREWRNATKVGASTGLTTRIGFEGGYLIPATFQGLLDKQVLEMAVVRPRAVIIPMDTQRTVFSMVDDTTHSGGLVFGGVASYFTSEEAQFTESRPTFANVELNLHKHVTFCKVSGEMLDWSPMAVDSWLPVKMAQAMAWKEDDKFIGGTGGAGEPIGLLNSACIVAIVIEDNQGAATFMWENLIKMDARLWAPDRSKVIWVANRTLKPLLSQLHMKIGTGGVPVFLPPDLASGRPYETLYGYPIVFTEHAKAAGTTGDIMLCNLGEYFIGDAQAKMRSERSIHLNFDYDRVAYRVIAYTGGLCPWRSAFTPQNGDTLSPVISLAARA